MVYKFFLSVFINLLRTDFSESLAKLLLRPIVKAMNQLSYWMLRNNETTAVVLFVLEWTNNATLVKLNPICRHMSQITADFTPLSP